MKKKNLLTLSVGCLLAFGGLSLTACNSTPAKHTITIEAPTGVTINGLNADKKYAKDDAVTFTINVGDATKYGVDTVKQNGTDVSKSGSNYFFAMPDQDVTLAVTLKDIRSFDLSFSAESVEVDEAVTYTVTCAGEDVTDSAQITFPGTLIAHADIVGHKIIGDEAGTTTVKATYDGLTVTKELTITASTKYSVENAEKAALTTPAAKKSGYSGVAYKVPGKILYFGAANNYGYSDGILYDGTNFLMTYTNKTTTESVSVGSSVVAYGELQNYFGLMEMAYNKNGTKIMQFDADTKVYNDPTPTTMDGAAFDAYYAKALAASTASQSTAGNTYDDLIQIAYIQATAVVVEKEGAKHLQIAGSENYLNLSASAANDAKALVEASPVGCEMTIKGFLEGANTSKGYSKFLLSSAAVVDVDVESVTAAVDKTEVAYGTTATVSATVNPTKGATQYGVTYAASPAEAVTIAADGTITPALLSEDTEVSITATCKGVTSEAVKITVKAAAEGDVVITSDVTTTEVDMNAQLTAIVVGQETPTITWTSSDESVATVDATGKVTAIKVGTTTITAACGEKSAAVNFSVTERVTPYHAGTEADPYTASDALMVAKQLASGAYTSSEVYLKANVSDKGTYNASYGNYTNVKVTDGTTTFTVYRMVLDSSVTSFSLKDEIVVKGYLQNYNGTSYQMTYNGSSTPTCLSKVAAKVAVSVDSESSEDVVIAGLPTETVENGTTVNFTVTLKDEVATTKEIKEVAVNGTALTAVEGTYSFTVDGDASVKVTTKNAGEVDPTAAVSQSKVTTNTTAAASTTAGTLTTDLGLDSSLFEVTYDKNGAGSDLAIRTDGIRMYATKATAKGNKLTYTLKDETKTIKYVEIAYDSGYSATSKFIVGEEIITGKTVSGATVSYEVNGNSFTIFNDNTDTTTATQVRFKTVTIYYL